MKILTGIYQGILERLHTKEEKSRFPIQKQHKDLESV
ncbi:hypothetical protein AAHB49_15800 [Bacillus cereus]